MVLRWCAVGGAFLMYEVVREGLLGEDGEPWTPFTGIRSGRAAAVYVGVE